MPNTAEWNRLRVREHWPKALAPKRIAHERKCATGEPVKRMLGAEQPFATSMSACELNRSLHALAPRTAKKGAPQPTARFRDQPVRQLRCKFRNTTLHQYWTTSVQLILNSRN
jgi:hypothetical protein